MNFSAIWTITRNDLIQRIRDRSVIVFGLVVPFALMFVFNLAYSGIESDELTPVTVSFAGTDKGVSEILVDTLESLDSLTVTVVQTDEAAAREAVSNGESDVALIVPQMIPTNDAPTTDSEIEVVTSATPSIEQEIVVSVIDNFVQYSSSTSQLASAAWTTRVPPEEIEDLIGDTVTHAQPVNFIEGEVSSEQLSTGGATVAGQASMFLFFTVGFGVLGLLAERENGTLARLLSMPISKAELIVGKTLVSFILGLVSTSVLLIAGSWLFDVEFGSFIPVAVLVVVAVAAATSLVVVIAKLARTAEQAMVTNSIAALVMSALGGAFFPVSNTGVLARIADVTPTAAFMRGLGITAGGGNVGDLGGPLLVLGGFIVVVVGLGLVVPNRDLV